MKNKTTTALLAFFAGGIGVHRFYLGQTGKGLAYLFFCWTFIPSFIALIDFIIFLTMSEDSFNTKYNSGKSPISSSGASDELGKLFDLKEKGAITEEEFNKKKATLL